MKNKLHPSIPVHYSEIIPNKLYVGDYFSSITAVLVDGFKYIISILDPGVNIIKFDEVKYLQIQLVDDPSSDITVHFQNAKKFIDSADGPVLIHCFVGAGRSVTVAGSYLISYMGFTSEQAINFIKERRPVANPNSGFRDQLEKYHKLCSSVV